MFVDARSSLCWANAYALYLGLFVQVELLEWADDLEMFHLKGYGETINYRMGIPLLEDVVQSMDRAMSDSGKIPDQSLNS